VRRQNRRRCGSLENVPATEAMLWLVEQNPLPDDEVRFSPITAASPTAS
jgi:hypothetical protein